jgi:hypothetical protein
VERTADAVLGIGDYFGSASYETQIIEGRRQPAGVVYRDNLARNRSRAEHAKNRVKTSCPTDQPVHLSDIC